MYIYKALIEISLIAVTPVLRRIDYSTDACMIDIDCVSVIHCQNSNWIYICICSMELAKGDSYSYSDH